MTPSRRPPHCKTCHKPLKGHKRAVCEFIDVLSPPTSVPTPTAPQTLNRSARGRKSNPQPVEKAPTLSPQSSEILNNLLRTNSRTFPPIKGPTAKENRRSSRNFMIGGQPVESLHAVLERLTTSEGKEQGTSERKYTPTEVDGGEESLEPEFFLSRVPTQVGAPSSSFSVSQKLHAEVSGGDTNSTFVVSQQLGLEISHDSNAQDIQEQHSADVTIQNFLGRMSQSSKQPLAMIFSFPTSAIPRLEDEARRLGLVLHVLPLPTSSDEWTPVVVGKDAAAITRLLEDSEKLAQTVRQSGASIGRDFNFRLSHVVVGSLGALATWAGLAYS